MLINAFYKFFDTIVSLTYIRATARLVLYLELILKLESVLVTLFNIIVDASNYSCFALKRVSVYFHTKCTVTCYVLIDNFPLQEEIIFGERNGKFY